MGIIEKSQAKYLSGYRKAMDLKQRKMGITDYAFNCHKKLVKGAVKRKVFLTQERDTWFCGKVSTGDPNVPYPRYIEVIVETTDQESHCSCMFFQEEGMRCEHIIALLRKKGQHVDDKWWFAQRFHAHTYFESYSGKVPTFALDKLQADISFVPPEHKRPAGRPSKTRKDRSYMNKTGKFWQCSSCGSLGHSFRTCERPSTQFRFEHHYDKAVAWTKNFNN